jgi:acyl transferase domain-containing protein/SAM-dependent methyltransferase/acyl carrier protein
MTPSKPSFASWNVYWVTTMAEDQLRRALGALQSLRQRYEALEAREREPIAIIGAACRLPGGCDTPEQFWRMLADGRDGVKAAPAERWPEGFYDPDPAKPGKSYVREGGFLDCIDRFDAQFFGISPREADQMDPQHRLALELAWEALEDTGQAADRLANSRTGVFLGLMSNDYGRIVQNRADTQDVDAYAGTGNDASFLAGRISYVLGLQGPSLVVSTSCSSSLVATHLAVQSLRRGECELALVGGVSLMLSPDLFVLLSKMRALAPDGRCHSFDASASGFGRGEGGGVLVLKRLRDAKFSGDRIMAVIRGSAINHDGHSNGLTAPNGAAQEEVLRMALSDAGIDSAEIGYLEAHGTGTSLGDPIELQAAVSVLGNNRAAGNAFSVGTVKANIGHLEAAAGVASLLKAALVVKNAKFVPQVNFERPNPHVTWNPQVFVVPRELTAWGSGKRIAGVSSFGMSGTNAHVVLESWEEKPSVGSEERAGGSGVLVLSARTEEALREQARRYSGLLERSEARVEDIAYTAAVGRVGMEERLVVSAEDWKSRLEEFAKSGECGRGVWRGNGRERSKVGFLYTGQGSQYAAMGRELYRGWGVFREAIDELSEVVAGDWGKGELQRLLLEGSPEEIGQTRRTQALLYALEIGLTKLWSSWGVEPDVVLGHSVGEYAAAVAAGVYSAAAGMRLIAWRGERMGRLGSGGAMAALLCSEAQARGWLTAGVEIAAENGPASVVVSGEEAVVERVLSQAQANGVLGQRLAVSHAFHSARMEPMLAEWEEFASGYEGSAGQARWVSTLSGEELERVDGLYWRRQVRERVRYRAAVEKTLALGCEVLVEIGPGSTLTSLGKRCAGNERTQWLTSLEKGRPVLEETAARLWAAGVPVQWERVSSKGQPRQRVSLPTYPFQRQRHWLQEKTIEKKRTRAREVYRLNWIRQDVLPPTLDSRMEAVFREGGSALRDTNVEQVNHLLDRLCLRYAWDAIGHWRNERGVLPPPEMAPVKPQHRQLTRLLYDWLADDGAIEPDSWRILSPPQDQISPEQILELHPDFAGYIRPLAACGPNLFEILQGENPLPLLFPGGSLAQAEEIYERNDYAAIMNRAAGEAASIFAQSAGRHLRILEVGAGTGGTTTSILQAVSASCERYTFTDLSTHFLARARKKFGQYPQMEYRTFDLERPAAEQAFTPGSYDLIIAANVLHATNDLGKVLANLRTLLSASGQLIILELTRPQRMADLTFGLLEGWWRFTDIELRPRHPLISAHLWLETLKKAGFQPLGAFPADPNAPQSVLVASNGTGEATSRWQVIGDNAIGEVIRQHLGVTDSPAPDHVVLALESADGEPVGLCSQILQVVQGLPRSAPPRLTVVWPQCAQPVAGALRAFLRCLAVEEPQLNCRWIEFSRYALASGMLVRELKNASPEQEVRLVETRMVTRLQAEPLSEPAFHPRSDSAYLITGGTGALGSSLTEWLLKHGAGEVVLLSRTGQARNSPENGRVRLVHADVQDETAMRAVLTGISQRTRLGGIFHAAGASSVISFAELTPAEIERMLSGKAAGAAVLHKITEDMPLDCFVLFSSAAAVWGSSRLAHYAAANGFLDGLAEMRSQLGLPSLSLQFGRLSERGMVPEAEYRHFDRMGLLPLALDTAWDEMARLMASKTTQAVLAEVDWNRFLPVFQAQGARKTLFFDIAQATAAPVPAASTLAAAAAVWRDLRDAETIKGKIRVLVAEVLGFDSVSALPCDRGLFELGLDSLMAVELRDRLAKALQLSLPATLIYERSTVDELSAYLSGLILGDHRPPVPVVSRLRSRGEEILNRIQSLSDADVDRLYSERFQPNGSIPA